MSGIVLSSFCREPFGLLALAPAGKLPIWSRPTLYFETGCGLTSTRTAGSELPLTCTWPTPPICASFWANTEEATSYNWGRGTTSEVRARIRIGWSAGFCFLYDGFRGRLDGRY